MTKKVAIVQSCYIPWKGYFDLINMVDEFILYDDMQYTRRDWRNRNLIKTPQGAQWLTIPVDVKGKYLQKINETKINDQTWAANHWKSIMANYARAHYFKDYSRHFEEVYLQAKDEDYLSQVNYQFLQMICSLLNIHSRITWSTDYKIDDDLKKTERLIALCQQAKATHYISGPSAKDYIQTNLFENAGIDLSYIEYSDYPSYTQLFGEFVHGVTILDLIFNMGPSAHQYLKTLRENS